MPNSNNNSKEVELQDLKRKLMGAWRTEYHAAISGTAQEEAEMHAYSLKVEAEFEAAINTLITKARKDEIEVFINSVHKGAHPNSYLAERYAALNSQLEEKQ